MSLKHQSKPYGRMPMNLAKLRVMMHLIKPRLSVIDKQCIPAIATLRDLYDRFDQVKYCNMVL